MPYALQVKYTIFYLPEYHLILFCYLLDVGGNHSSTDVVENILKILSTKRVNW